MSTSRFIETEATDGVRFSWNILPMTKADAAELHVPITALYTPFKPIDGLGTVQYKPVLCGSCGGILNPFCRVNTTNKTWSCSLCNSGNHFPAHYAGITATNKPAELMSQYTTLEYTLDSRPAPPPVFLFVVDTFLIADELAALADALAQAVLMAPADAVVGLITFGRHVRLYELGALAAADTPALAAAIAAMAGADTATGTGPAGSAADGASAALLQRSYVFHGDKTVTKAELMAALGISDAVPVAPSASAGAAGAAGATEAKTAGSPAAAGGAAGAAGANGSAGVLGGAGAGLGNFLAPLADCDSHLTSILSALTKDPFPYDDKRCAPPRCTGAALALAVTLLDLAAGRGRSGRILAFLGGACATPPGQIASTSLETPIRSHHDLLKNNPSAAYHKSAVAFYQKLASQAAANGHTIDLYIGCLDQVGLAEMRTLVSETGGRVVLDDSFTRGVFKGSLHQMFTCDEDGALALGFGAELHVQVSPELTVVGAIGPLSSQNRKATYVAASNPLNQGVGGTCAWTLGGLDESTTVAVYLDVTKAEAAVAGETVSSYVQFSTRYRHSSGATRLRVTTLARMHADIRRDVGHAAIVGGFDQEAAVAAVTRWAVHKTLTEYTLDVLRWTEKMLVSFVSNFATYRPGDVSSFRLAQNMVFFPQFIFHLRRSQFLQVFNNSPDETAFFRTICLHETVTNTLLMVQPTLTGYSLEAPTAPLMLDVSSCASNRILLLDTYFHIVVWYGDTISRWRADNVQANPQYAFFAQLLKAPLHDAKALMATRFPTPRFIECVERGSQSRFLLAKLNPSVTHSSSAAGAGAGAAAAAAAAAAGVEPGQQEPLIFTEDSNLKGFIDMLKSVVVSKGRQTAAAAAAANAAAMRVNAIR